MASECKNFPGCHVEGHDRTALISEHAVGNALQLQVDRQYDVRPDLLAAQEASLQCRYRVERAFALEVAVERLLDAHFAVAQADVPGDVGQGRVRVRPFRQLAHSV
jgi:hypothetical protein